MSTTFPRTELGLLDWGANFDLHFLPDPTVFGGTPVQAAAVSSAYQALVAAAAATSNPETDTRMANTRKREARAEYLRVARPIVRMIQVNPAVTDEQRNLLRIHIPKPRSTRRLPGYSPGMQVRGTTSRRISLRVHGEDSLRRIPDGAAGANVFVHEGPTVPDTLAEWLFWGQTTRSKVEIELAPSTSARTVWVTASWYGYRGETGVAATPISVNLPAAPLLPEQNGLKIAA